MVIPVDQEIANLACEKMKSFYNDLINLYSANGIDLEANRGRRNMLMSDMRDNPAVGVEAPQRTLGPGRNPRA